MFSLSTPIEQIGYLAGKLREPFERIHIKTVKDILFYFPFRYQDLSQMMPIVFLHEGESFCVRAKIEDMRVRRIPRRRLLLIEATVCDDTGSLEIIWFNQTLIPKMLHVGDDVIFAGKVEKKGRKLQMSSPTYEKMSVKRTLSGPLHTARIVPEYPLTEGLSQKQLRVILKFVFDKLPKLKENFPNALIEKEQFVSLDAAIREIHFPRNSDTLEMARRRLAFGELFSLHLRIQNLKREIQKSISPRIDFFENETRAFVQSLPFELTSDQKKSAWVILQNMQQPHPMHRLLNGDVGSGKTVVAALAIFNTWKNGFQSAILCPTEVLTRQHFATFSQLFRDHTIRIGLFTRSNHLFYDGTDPQELTKDDFRKRVKNGRIDLVIGTHAILREEFSFSRLALAVVDEQHRFGISQRAWLRTQSGMGKLVPHFLSVSATPIPRTLFLSFFGDLDISTIQTIPQNRKKTETKLFLQTEREKMYDFILKEIKENGSQVFVVCPLISESDILGVKSVEQEYQRLTSAGVAYMRPLQNLRFAMLHGKMKSAEKEKILFDFRERKYDVLVTTSVIEVGIDIPNATIMLIEDPQRFGLAQLHQFRGRIGRGEKQGYCFLISDHEDITKNLRIQTFEKISDGFALAEKDLEFRGGGDVQGVRQSGMPHFKIARLSDYSLSSRAQKWAKRLSQK